MNEPEAAPADDVPLEAPPFVPLRSEASPPPELADDAPLAPFAPLRSEPRPSLDAPDEAPEAPLLWDSRSLFRMSSKPPTPLDPEEAAIAGKTPVGILLSDAPSLPPRALKGELSSARLSRGAAAARAARRRTALLVAYFMIAVMDRKNECEDERIMSVSDGQAMNDGTRSSLLEPLLGNEKLLVVGRRMDWMGMKRSVVVAERLLTYT